MSQRKFHGLLKHWDFILNDLLCLQGCYIIAYWILHGISNPYSNQNFLLLAVLFSFSQTLVILFTENYHGILRRKRFDELVAVCSMIIETLLLTLVFLFISHFSQMVSRLQTGSTVLVYIVIDYLMRQIIKRRIKSRTTWDYQKKKLVLFTSSRLYQEVKQRLYRSDTWRDFILSKIVLFDDETAPSAFEGIPIVHLSDEILKQLSHEWVDEVFIFQPDDMLYPEELINNFIDMGLTVSYTLESLSKAKWQEREMRKLGSIRVVTNSVRLIRPGDVIFKRAFDILCGIAGCLVTGFLCLIIGPLIKLADPGPIFFGQMRVGQNGRQFKLYKFRSMYMDAEKRKAELLSQNRVKDGMMFKLDDDPRIIGSEKKDRNGKPAGIGNFIRKTSLDEFPQFFNVLKGEMSVVGWRPCTLDEWEKYELKHRIRASMKPGITGMWQVSGRSTITDFEEVVRLDREYIENWSLALDAKILLKTIAAVFNRKGAE